MTASNGQQEAARLERAVNTFVDRLRATPPDLLTRAPADGEWNARQLAAHEAEICAYWAQQLAYLKTHPGQPFGRTAEDADRIRYIEDHKDSIDFYRWLIPHVSLDGVFRVEKDK